jgi:hypothetical protein
MSSYRVLAVCALTALSAPALAQNQNSKPAPVQQRAAPAPVQQRPAPVQQRPAAVQQLHYANQGTAQRNHVFDGTKPPPGPVYAKPAAKPSVVGVPASQFKPVVHVTPAKPPPAPTLVGSVPRSKLNPTGDPQVQKGINNYRRPGT